jgi:hypothetical protein
MVLAVSDHLRGLDQLPCHGFVFVSRVVRGPLRPSPSAVSRRAERCTGRPQQLPSFFQ